MCYTNNMNTHILIAARALSDADLLSRLADLARRERDTTAELVAHLAEMEVRQLYLAEGYRSLFKYCTEALRLSEHAAYNRIEAARVAQDFPVVLDRLADGSINVTTLSLVAAHLTQENHLDVLAAAAGRSKREVEVVVARLAPRSDVAASVRKLPETSPARTLPGPSAASPSSTCLEMAPVTDAPFATPVGAPVLTRSVEGPAPSHRPVVVPLAPERYRVQFTIGAETHEKLRLAQDWLRREIPDGDPAAIFDRALTLLLADVARKKVGATSKARPASGSRQIPAAVQRSRHIPAQVKRKVWLRDQGRCAFISTGGRRCDARAYLEFHHVEPYAIGGETTARNISLRCRSHNRHEAELVFGKGVIGEKLISVRQGNAGVATRSGTSSKGNTRGTSATPDEPLRTRPDGRAI
jgi:hypothetical protein